MKFTTTLILATFGLSATSASSGGGGGGVRGGVNFYEAAAEGDFENIPNNGHVDQFCHAISCDDDPCGNTTDTQTGIVDICTLVDHGAGGHLPCDNDYECQGCGSDMPNAYICKLEEETPSFHTTEQ